MTIALNSADELHGLTLVWLDNWWDAPLSGVALYRGLAHSFEAVWDSEKDDWVVPHVFQLHALDAEQRRQAWKRHRFFEQVVGTVYCYHAGIERGVQRPEEMHHKFYDRYPSPASKHRGNRQPLGWFQEAELGDFLPRRRPEIRQFQLSQRRCGFCGKTKLAWSAQVTPAICGECVRLCREVAADSPSFPSKSTRSTREAIFTCSFCARPSGPSRRVIAGPGVFICTECIDAIGVPVPNMSR